MFVNETIGVMKLCLYVIIVSLNTYIKSKQCDYLLQNRLFTSNIVIQTLVLDNNCQYSDSPLMYFANIVRCRLTFAQRFFRSKATQWWNSLPAFVTRTICNGRSGAFQSALQQYIMDSAIVWFWLCCTYLCLCIYVFMCTCFVYVS